MIRAVRACYAAGGHELRGHLVFVVLFGIAQRIATVGLVIAWGSAWFIATLLLLLVVGAAYRWLRTYTHIRAVGAMLKFVARASLADSDFAFENSFLSISDAVHRGARGLVLLAAPLIADITASLVVLGLLGCILKKVSIIVVFAAFLLGGGAAFVARAVTMRQAGQSHRAYLDAIESVGDAVDGRLEVIAEGATNAVFTRTTAAIRTWLRMALRSDGITSLTGRLPLLVGGVFVTSVVVAIYGYGPAVMSDAVLLLAAAPSFVATAQGVHELWKTAPETRVLANLAARNHRENGKLTPPDYPATIAWETVSFGYGDGLVLNGASVIAKRGAILALTGPNGSGKSTLLRIAAALIEPTSGRFLVGGEDVAVLDRVAWRQQLRYLPQRPYLLPRRDVRAAICFPAIGAINAEEVLREVGLWPRLALHPDPLAVQTDALSAGERQRLALARILAREADIYLLDEPDANLDAGGVGMVAELTRRLAQAGKLVVVAAHTPELIAAADQTVRLECGRIVSVVKRGT